MQTKLDPFDLPEQLRSYFYDAIVLAWETKRVQINKARFSRQCLEAGLGFRVENLRKISEVEARVGSLKSSEQILIFHVQGKGYECLLKRLRDSFAHGHYGKGKSNWITINHRYKGRNDKRESTRLFARVKQSKIKELVEFLADRKPVGNRLE